MNSGNRPQLPLAPSGCSCCAPAHTAEPASTLPGPVLHDSPAAVVNSDADASTRRNIGWALG